MSETDDQKTPPKSWRDLIPVYPAADLFPQAFSGADRSNNA